MVRLKGGDPLIFGRGGEEAEALRGAGVAYEIVPGVTAALAAGAYLEIPLTHRNYASAVALVTGHELPNKPGNRLDWKALAAFPGTLAIYMGIARLPVIVAELLKHGKDPDTPGGDRRAGQHRRAADRCSRRLADLEEARRNAGLEAPGLILDRRGGGAAARRIRGSNRGRSSAGAVLVTRPRTRPGDGPQARTPRGRRRTGCRPSRSASRPTSARSTARSASSAPASGTGSSSPAPTASTPSSAGWKHSAATCATSAA